MGMFDFFKKKDEENIEQTEREKYILEEAKRIIDKKVNAGGNMGELIIGADGRIKKASDVQQKEIPVEAPRVTMPVEEDMEQSNQEINNDELLRQYKEQLEQRQRQEMPQQRPSQLREENNAHPNEEEIRYREFLKYKEAEAAARQQQQQQYQAPPEDNFAIITISLKEQINIDIEIDKDKAGQVMDFIYNSIIEKKILRISNRLIPVDKILMVTIK